MDNQNYHQLDELDYFDRFLEIMLAGATTQPQLVQFRNKMNRLVNMYSKPVGKIQRRSPEPPQSPEFAVTPQKPILVQNVTPPRDPSISSNHSRIQNIAHTVSNLSNNANSLGRPSFSKMDVSSAHMSQTSQISNQTGQQQFLNQQGYPQNIENDPVKVMGAQNYTVQQQSLHQSKISNLSQNTPSIPNSQPPIYTNYEPALSNAFTAPPNTAQNELTSLYSTENDILLKTGNNANFEIPDPVMDNLAQFNSPFNPHSGQQGGLQPNSGQGTDQNLVLVQNGANFQNLDGGTQKSVRFGLGVQRDKNIESMEFDLDWTSEDILKNCHKQLRENDKIIKLKMGLDV